MHVSDTVGVLSSIGGTPLVRLLKLFAGHQMSAFAKLESLNPGGSIKDRPAVNMVEGGIRRGIIVPGRTVVVESSSGNLGIGLAQVCGYYDIRFICVVDRRTTKQNIAILRAYGAEVELVNEPDPATGDYLPARLARTRALVDETPNALWLNQYANPLNPQAHHQTVREIIDELGAVDFIFCAAGSCGTLRGAAEYIRAKGLQTRLVAVDAVGSVIFGGPSGPRLIPGHGAAVRPAHYAPDLADDVVLVSDLDCVVGCRKLALQESLLCGGSSGGIVSAVERLAPSMQAGSVCALILADRGDRYLDTVFDDVWVADHLGDVSGSWTKPQSEVAPC